MHRDLLNVIKPNIQQTFTPAGSEKKLSTSKNDQYYKLLQLRANTLTPLPSKGKLVDDYALSPIDFAKDTYQDIKNVGKALIHGDADDYSLGRMNDLGMKIGGLAIASYLFTRRNTVTSQKMEFVGFAAFFATMALVPKLLIEKPLQWMYGFNIHQKYEDSQGRKKMFFLDPQYLPWDIWSSKKINEIGDKMDVDKDAKDREELIKRKMAKIALQGNTLWMLTAGFLTPLLTALGCNKLEKYFEPIFKNMHYKKILKEFENIDLSAQETTDFERKGRLEKLLKSLDGKVLKEEDIKRLAVLISLPEEADTEKIIINHIKETQSIHENRQLEGFYKVIYEQNKQFFDAHNMSEEEIKNICNSRITLSDPRPENIVENIKNDITDRIGSRTQISGRKKIAVLVESSKTVDDAYKSIQIRKFSKKDASHLINIFDNITVLRGKYDNVSKFIAMIVGKTEDALLSDAYKHWSNGLIKGLKLDYNALAYFTQGEPLAYRTSVKTFSALASDDKAYLKFFTLLDDLKAPLESKQFLDILDKLRNEVIDAVKKDYQKLENELGVKGMAEVFDKGKLHYGENAPVSFVHNINKKVNIALDGIHASMNRLFLMLDLERRIHTGALEEQFNRWMFHYNAAQTQTMGVQPKIEMKYEKFIKIARDFVYKHTYADAANKNYLNKRSIYAMTMDILFKEDAPMDSLTREALKQLGNGDEKLAEQKLAKFIAARKSYFDLWGTTDNVYRNWARMGSAEATDAVKHARAGSIIMETMEVNATRIFNNMGWKKTFVLPTILLVAGTVLSGLFFGKIHNEELYSKRGSK